MKLDLLSQRWERNYMKCIHLFRTVMMSEYHSERFITFKTIKYFGGDNNITLTFTINTKYSLLHFYVFKMAVSIAFLCKNAVEEI